MSAHCKHTYNTTTSQCLHVSLYISNPKDAITQAVAQPPKVQRRAWHACVDLLSVPHRRLLKADCRELLREVLNVLAQVHDIDRQLRREQCPEV